MNDASSDPRAERSQDDLLALLTQCERELAEARRQQAATAEILKLISRSTFELDGVLQNIVEALRAFCGNVTIHTRDGDLMRLRAWSGSPPEFVKFLQETPFRAQPRTLTGKAWLTGKAIYVRDVASQSEFHFGRAAEIGNLRSVLCVPMMRDDEALGVLTLGSPEHDNFKPNHIDQVKSFADQAVIAIENLRRFNETREALEQQKATSDVLSAIGRSVSDAGPAFERILDACQRLFGSDQIGIYTVDASDMVRVAAWRGPMSEEFRHDVTPLAESVTGRVIRERSVHHIPDLAADPHLPQKVRERVEHFGSTTLVYAPILFEDRGIGSILVSRTPPRPFTEKEQALLQSFADQAAIAIQNVRLFEEVQAKSRDLNEALVYQTGSGDILRAIAASPTDVAPVLNAIVESACRVCEAYDAAVILRDGEFSDSARIAARYPSVSTNGQSIAPGSADARSSIACRFMSMI